MNEFTWLFQNYQSYWENEETQPNSFYEFKIKFVIVFHGIPTIVTIFQTQVQSVNIKIRQQCLQMTMRREQKQKMKKNVILSVFQFNRYFYRVQKQLFCLFVDGWENNKHTKNSFIITVFSIIYCSGDKAIISIYNLLWFQSPNNFDPAEYVPMWSNNRIDCTNAHSSPPNQSKSSYDIETILKSLSVNFSLNGFRNVNDVKWT